MTPKANHANSNYLVSIFKMPGKIYESAYRKFKAKKKSSQAAVIFSLFAFLIFAAWASWSYLQVTTPSRLFDVFPDDIDPNFFDWGAWDAESYFDQNIVNLVLLGFDKNEAREEQYTSFRTDSIKVFSINFDKGKASIINIPRDLYVQIADTTTRDKINHAYFHGFRYGRGEDPHKKGIEYSLKSISYVLGGVPLKYYVTVDMGSVVTLVDSIGGVEFTVEEDIYFKGRVWVKAGHQILDGKRYLRYLRSREDGGDIGRVNRQTELLLATLEHFKKKGLFTQIPTFYNAYQDNVETNLSHKQIISLALYARNFKTADIQTFTMSGPNQSKDGIYYMAMDQAKRAKIIQDVFGISFAPPPQEQLTDTMPKPPTAFTVDHLQHPSSGKGLLLSWEPGDRYNLAYNLYRSVNGGPEEIMAEKLEEESFWDLHISSSSTYKYRLEAVNRRVVSNSVFLEKIVKEKAPSKPLDFSSQVDANTVTLTWRAGDDGTTGFRLVRRDSQSQEKVLLDNVLSFSFNDKNLPEGEYTYRLAAINAEGMYSDSMTLTVAISSSPEGPGEPEEPKEPVDPEEPKDPEEP